MVSTSKFFLLLALQNKKCIVHMMTELEGGKNSDTHFTTEGKFRRNAVLVFNSRHNFCCNDVTAEYTVH